MSLFDDEQPLLLPLPDAELVFHARIDLQLPHPLAELVANTPWRSDEITVFGKTHAQPRLVAWYGDAGARYTYSGIRHEPLPWTPLLQHLRERIEHMAQARFNSVLLNYYRNNNDSMGLHADDEPELGENPVIASLSLGDERTFYFKHKTRHDIDNCNLPLPDCSLLIMRGETQQHWKHGIRKVRRTCGPRINLTFRHIQH